jgi:hypothetical protein
MYQTIKYWRNPILELAGLRGPISCTSVVRGPLYNTLAHVEYSLLYFIYFNWHNCKCGLNFSHFFFNLIKFWVQSLFGDIYWFLKNVSRYNICLKWIAIYRYFDIIAQPYFTQMFIQKICAVYFQIFTFANVLSLCNTTKKIHSIFDEMKFVACL